jgi:microcompartment protein CcmK/EutM
MRIAKVIGTVTLNSQHPQMRGARYKVVVPQTLENLSGSDSTAEEELTAYDDLGADVGCLVAISEGREAAMPFHPEPKAIDAYIGAILDSVEVDAKFMKTN